MAQYKVPQDVEAEDKLLGPFTFRQFIYLLIAAACAAAAWGFFQLFAPLAIIPLPIGIFFAILALPLRKDQPMETYLVAVINYYMKPHKRYWMPGQSNTTIQITAPKTVEASRTRNITEEEASHRLSFLADLIDTEGYSIKSLEDQNSSIKAEYLAEADTVTDVLDANENLTINKMIQQDQSQRHAALVDQMRQTIAQKDMQRYAEQNADMNYQPLRAVPDIAPLNSPGTPPGAPLRGGKISPTTINPHEFNIPSQG